MKLSFQFSAGQLLVRTLSSLGVLLVSGCATNSLFTPYPAQTAPYMYQVEKGTKIDADKLFGRKVMGRDRVLYRMEQGRLAQLQGNLPTSRAAYADAIAANREQDDKAVVTVSGMVGKTSSLLINDNAIPYVADGYERVMLHHEQALNYLFSGDVEGAGVEVRRAAFEQAEALKRRENELAAARNQEQKQGASVIRSSDLAIVNARLDAAAGRVKNSFQNAYTFYMSGVVRELLNDPDGAYIDYKKAAEIHPENPYVRRDVLRLAEDLGMDEAALFRERWPGVLANRIPKGQGEVIVFFEDGFLPSRTEFSMPIPLFNNQGGFTAIALPVYEPSARESAPVALETAVGPAGDTALVCDLNAMAARALQERMPAIMTRQIVRATAKAMAPQLVHGRDRDVVTLIMSLYAFITERADLRSWTTLPQAAQVLRTPCPPGRQVFTLTHRGTGARAVCEAEVRPGGRTIVLVVRTGGRLTARSVTF
jgi:hypothetical protein